MISGVTALSWVVVCAPQTDNHRVVICDVRTGAFIRTIGRYGHNRLPGHRPEEPYLDWPTGISALPRGSSVAVSDTRNNRIVVLCTESGAFMQTVCAGFCQRPRGVAALGSGSLLAVCDEGNRRVLVVCTRTGVSQPTSLYYYSHLNPTLASPQPSLLNPTTTTTPPPFLP